MFWGFEGLSKIPICLFVSYPLNPSSLSSLLQSLPPFPPLSYLQNQDLRIEVGMNVELPHIFEHADVQTFAALSGDDNPIHLDTDYATKRVRGMDGRMGRREGRRPVKGGWKKKDNLIETPPKFSERCATYAAIRIALDCYSCCYSHCL